MLKCRLSFIKHNIPQVGGNLEKSRVKNKDAAVAVIKLFQWELITAPPTTELACENLTAERQQQRQAGSRHARRSPKDEVSMKLNSKETNLFFFLDFFF